MNKLVTIALTSLFAVNLAFAQATAPAAPAKAATPAKAVEAAKPAAAPAVAPAVTAVAAAPVGGCEAKAVSKSGKPLTGAAKTASIKKCEKAAGTAVPATGKKDAQQEKMKACNAGAKGKKGDERKAFMKDCLSK